MSASVLLLLGLLTAVSADCIVYSDNSCKANCSGTVLDISNLVTYPYQIDINQNDGTPIGKYFSYNPCQGIGCVSTDDNSAVCLIKDSSEKVSCGLITSSSTVWQLISSDPYEFTIQYGCDIGADCQASLFTFTQTKDKDVSVAYTGGSTDYYEFAIKGKCVGQNSCEEPHHEDAVDVTGLPGLILILLCLVGLATYFIAGILVMKFVKGATGKELIPNYAFWSDLPYLIKDGCLFVVSPCLQRKIDYEKI
ncbi:PREDICTED: uncharacterized protein LOC105312512 isoform X3 [Amphimedon queenslandica]|uniref:Cation-dependent mannose-6-phosphate receptor n=1 Tax=Amphimedon queenslandica TaxID=400682 RepID=A0A1X7V1G2_AMPQE|nr:PREDICTED: uncharacterized protein LOC105312512 isoform X3 [Amphimedon queenslandica]|eukprot:XP_019851241.1 PREDICTED: uncharacterized protein LOC105312512 isoform X3 [Amphimedon queenslandica]